MPPPIAQTVALHLLGGDDARVVSVPLRRTETDGTLVLALRHPVSLPIGRQLTISIPSEHDWQTQRVRVEAPRFKPHDDAGLLRLTIVPGGAAAENYRDATGEPDEPATATAAASRSAAAQPAVPLRAELRAWQGRHPTGSVALRLKSGRVRTMKTQRVDEEATLVLSARRPAVLKDGEEVQLAWSHRRGWLMATMSVAESRPDGHPDAGLLRLALQGDPKEQKERRSSERRVMKLGLRAEIERSTPKLRGSRFECSTLDVSIGGAAFLSDLDLAAGDRLKLRLIGPSGQLPGGEFGAEVLRLEALPDGAERKVVIIWRDAPAELRKALQRLIEAES